jgi:hypothetical protein
MTCVSDGMLKTYLDRELSIQDAGRVEAHLACCARCRERADRMEAGSLKLNRLLDELAPLPGELPETSAAYARLRAGLAQQRPQKTAWLQTLYARRWRPAMAAAAIATVLASGLGLRPARSWAQHILAMLRVQKIAVVPVDLETLKTENGNGRAAKMVMQLISDKVIETIPPTNPSQVASVDDASKAAGFDVRLPSALGGTPRVMVESEWAVQMTLDRARLQSILEEAGRGDLQIPPDADGALVAVHVPKSVMAFYGDCPKPQRQDSVHQPGQVPQPPASGVGCTVLTQSPSPVVSVPPNLNIGQLAEIALQFAGMTPTEAHQFCGTVDWTTTLVVPVPTGGSRTVTVDGVQAAVAELRPLGALHPRYAMVWIKNGIIYSLMGNGSATEGETVADSLQ